MDPPAEKIIELYERHAVAWDAARRREPLLEAGWLTRFCGGLSPGASVLDLGCGGGEPIASYLVAHGVDVTGIDSSATMISLFRRRLPGSRALHCDMRSLHLELRFGGIIAWDSFFHLTHDDQRAVFAVLRRHSAPGAILLFTTGPEHGEAMGALEGEPLFHASLDAVGYRALLSSNGYAVLGHVVRDSSCGGRTVWLAQLRPRGSPAVAAR